MCSSNDIQTKSNPNSKSKNKKQDFIFRYDIENNDKVIDLLKHKRPKSKKQEKAAKSKEKNKAKQATKPKKEKKAEKEKPPKKKNNKKANKSIKIEHKSVIAKNNDERSFINLCDTTIDDEIVCAPNKLKDQVIVTTKKKGRPKKTQTEQKKPASSNKKQQSDINPFFSKSDIKHFITNITDNKDTQKRQKETQIKIDLFHDKEKSNYKLLKHDEIKVNSSNPSIKKDSSGENSIKMEIDINSLKRSFSNNKTSLDTQKPKSAGTFENLFSNFTTCSEDSLKNSPPKNLNFLKQKVIKIENLQQAAPAANNVNNNKELDSDEENDSSPGSFDYDIPLRIEMFTLNEANNVFGVVSWKPRYDGSIPRKSIFPVEEIQDNWPRLLNKYLMDKLNEESTHQSIKAVLIN